MKDQSDRNEYKKDGTLRLFRLVFVVLSFLS